MAKVAIDAGHASNTNGKRTPTGYREHWFNVTVANYIDIGLKRCGIQTLKVAWNDTNSKDDPEVSLGERQRQIKNSKCDIAISCHANASGDGKSYNSVNGLETFIHNTSEGVGDSKRLANLVHNYLIKGTQQSNRGIKASGLAMCNCKSMGVKAAILIEYAFMTNQREEQLIKSDSFCRECAEETVHGICDYLGVNYVSVNDIAPAVVTQTNSKKLYRVQCGAFSTEQNAKTIQQKISSAGLSTTIKHENGLYKVQIGAFGNKANAEYLRDTAISKGFDATLVYY